MSEQLYRKVYRNKAKGEVYPKPHPIAEWINRYWLVPVEPCEHGNYDRHIIEDTLRDGCGFRGSTPLYEWCDE